MLRIEFASLADWCFIIRNKQDSAESTLVVPESFTLEMPPGSLTQRVRDERLLTACDEWRDYRKSLSRDGLTNLLVFLVSSDILKKPVIKRGEKVFPITPGASNKTIAHTCPPDCFIVGFSTLINAPEVMFISKSREPLKDISNLPYKNWHWYYTNDLKKLITSLFHILNIKNNLSRLQFLNMAGRSVQATYSPRKETKTPILFFIDDNKPEEVFVEEKQSCAAPTQVTSGFLAPYISQIHTAVLINNFFLFARASEKLISSEFHYCCEQVFDRINRHSHRLSVDYLKRIKTKQTNLLKQFIMRSNTAIAITDVSYNCLKVKIAQMYVAVFHDKYAIFKKAVEHLSPLEFNYARELVKRKIQNKYKPKSAAFFGLVIAKPLDTLDRLSNQFLNDKAMTQPHYHCKL